MGRLIRRGRGPIRALAAAFRRFQAHSGTYLAAAVAYYLISALFPFLLGTVALLSLLLDAEGVRSAVVGRLTHYLPGSERLVTSAVDEALRARGPVGVVSVGFSLWSATGIVGAAGWAVNRALDAPPARPLIRQKLVELGTVIGAGLFLWASTLLLGGIRIIAQLTPLVVPGTVETAAYLAGTGLSAVLSFGMFAVLYRLLATVKLQWACIWPGALLAALGVELGKHLFVLYLDRFATRSLVHGAAGTVLGLLLWAYLAGVVFTFGAEVVAVCRRADRPSS